MHGTLRVIMKKILKQSQWNRIWDNFQNKIGLITVFNWKQFEDYYQHSPKSITHLLFQYFFESWRVEHYITIAISMLQISNKVNFFKPGEKDFEKLTFTWMTRPSIIALAIIQKRESQHGDNKKAKHAKFSEKTNISCTPICTSTCAYQKVRNVRFSENVACFVLSSPPYHYYWQLYLFQTFITLPIFITWTHG